eukprot:265107-Amorphochlora_amoeboformis.AAC.1
MQVQGGWADTKGDPVIFEELRVGVRIRPESQEGVGWGINPRDPTYSQKFLLFRDAAYQGEISSDIPFYLNLFRLLMEFDQSAR